MGNLILLTASVPAVPSLSGITTFGYDGKNQLLNELSTHHGSYSHAYVYDTAGNPTSFNGVNHSFGITNQLTDSGVRYDGNGNPTTYHNAQLTYDSNNGLTAYVFFITKLTAGYTGDGLRAKGAAEIVEHASRLIFCARRSVQIQQLSPDRLA